MSFFKEMETGIAVIIPVYNVKKYLSRCLDSILNQTFEDFMLILVDDGSTDGSSEICDDYARKDSRIHVIHQKNAGCAEARKNGVLYEGVKNRKYINFVDADDYLPNNALEELYHMAENYDADCVCGVASRVWKAMKINTYSPSLCFQIAEPMIYEHNDIIEKLYVSCFGITNFPVSLWGKLYRKEMFISAMEQATVLQFMGEDSAVTLRVMPQIKRLVIIPDIVYYYRIGGGTSRFIDNMLNNALILHSERLQLAKKWLMPFDIEKLLSIDLMNVINSYLLMCIREGKFTDVKLQNEINKIMQQPEIVSAAQYLCNNNENHPVALLIANRDYEGLKYKVKVEKKKSLFKYKIKRVLLSL